MTTRNSDVRILHKLVEMKELRQLGLSASDTKKGLETYHAYQICKQPACIDVAEVYCIGSTSGENACEYAACSRHIPQTVSATGQHIWTEDKPVCTLTVLEDYSKQVCRQYNPRYDDECQRIEEVICEACNWYGCLMCALLAPEHRVQAMIGLGWEAPASTPADTREGTGSLYELAVSQISPKRREHLEWVTERAKKAREESDATMARIMSGTQR